MIAEIMRKSNGNGNGTEEYNNMGDMYTKIQIAMMPLPNWVDVIFAMRKINYTDEDEDDCNCGDCVVKDDDADDSAVMMMMTARWWWWPNDDDDADDGDATEPHTSPPGDPLEVSALNISVRKQDPAKTTNISLRTLLLFFLTQDFLFHSWSLLAGYVVIYIQIEHSSQ